MNQEVLNKPIVMPAADDDGSNITSTWQSYIPAFLAIFGSLALVLIRINVGGERFISDGALMMLALASYLIAAVFHLTNLYAPFRFAEKLGLFAATLGVFFNLSSWLVRWVAAYDRELAIFNTQGSNPADMPWVFRYVPFANLYDLSLAFAFGAGITTLIVMRRKQFQIVAALSLPLAAIILVLARFIGSEIIDLPPVLDSYWRPIHVGIASLSYGIALVCFAVAVLYLLKDGLKVEKMAIWTSIFALGVFFTISKFSVFAPATFGTYTASTFVGTSRMSLGLRADIPYVGWLIVAASALLVAASIGYALYTSKNDLNARSWANRFLYAALAVQGAGVAMLVYQLKNLQNVVAAISPSQYPKFAVWMLQQQDMPQAQINMMGQQQLYDISNKWVIENGANLHLSLNANPVELAALITAFTGTFFIVMFGINTEKIRSLLPATEKLDGLMYKLAGVTFAGLALLLITGAVWANESWGRYWGWDAKEVGALVAWLTYAGFLHSRIAYGWRGRRSAYFAVVAFLFVIFTYLGVSYLLPGLHSYA
ncbi:MAG TPA: cytochrome c biogenesis protein CcsA [Pyrinomonadaceae bacterium]|nr:cytochrome c biogenesis protein CcsA [Chloracidobacterium sp.]MBP9934995.1 cytochrome c biogenesis protein CcsA [Pyrinomonadaceae bacterium]MBK7801379.1 cytochrome c biogenesis protein CcsA [Chloracidobacterium sp.]MBK9436698.1 cytochrome c biogenesis protein CcsA [Chloracidobacterium sp.]MBL0241688.1 cytochrome c biogenesis protein CcsA [Chloracidobacterium sp.]